MINFDQIAADSPQIVEREPERITTISQANSALLPCGACCQR
jgi:cytidine deaminase